ncbi:MAG: two-component system OmpR family sensor kinase [Halovenus sp.]|jgi:two-component system OmpR family sensor kinase
MTRTDDPIHVLYVDSDTGVSERVVAAFERTDDRFEVVTAGDAADGERALSGDIDCVVAADDLPGTDGARFLRSVREDCLSVLFTAVDPGNQAPLSTAADEIVRSGGGDDAYTVLATSVLALVTRRRAGQRGGYRQEQLRRMTGNLERLHEAVNKLYGTGSIEDSYDITIDTAVDILGLDWCSLVAPAADADVFEIQAVSDRTTVDVGHRPFGLDEGIAGQVYQTNETHILDDRRESDRAQPTDSTIRSAISVPVGDWGVFQAMSSEVRAFDERDRNRAELLCTSLATAIERNQREHALEAQNERLEEFASIVSHDLRNPLSTFSLSLDLAEETGNAEHFDRCRRSVERMDRLVEALLTLARAGEDITDTEPVELADAVEGAWDTVETRGADLLVETDLWLDADRVRLEQLLANLFQNSIQHGLPDDHETHRPAHEQPGDDGVAPVGDLTVRVSDIDDGFAVEDSGPGIPADERDDIFEAGYTTSADGTGLGLRIVDQVAGAHGWAVRVTDGIDGGARFEVSGVGAVE